MIYFITKLRHSKAMFFVLVTALLSIQWSSAHIHLAEHHDHGGSHHEHNTKAHAHQSLIHNDDFNGSSRQTFQEVIKVVELGNDCNLNSWNNIDDQSIALASISFPKNLFSPLKHFTSSGFRHSKRRYIDYSTIKLRAPPKFS